MSRKKANKDTKMLVEGDVDHDTGSRDLSTNWQGRVIVLNTEKSVIAEKMGFKKKAEYAIKVR
jgi:RNA polymerase subunit RPABC4/transcription elongation factor Spt4